MSTAEQEVSSKNVDEHRFNQHVIQEFRASQGRVGGMFEGAALLLLHHTGAKSASERISPLAYQAVGTSYAIFGANAGKPTNPAWLYNLIANPRTIIEVGGRTLEVVARVTEGAERDAIWERQKATNAAWGKYEARTPRSIPVVLLEPVVPNR